MKVTILDGMPSASSTLGTQVEAYFRDSGVEVTAYHLADEDLGFCLGCFECWTTSPGRCRIDDGGRRIAQSVIAADWAVYLTSVTFGGYASQLKKAVDRLLPLILPFFRMVDGEIHHQLRYRSYPSLLGIGSLLEPDPELEAVFRMLIERNAINFESPHHAAVFAYEDHLTQQLKADLSLSLGLEQRSFA